MRNKQRITSNFILSKALSYRDDENEPAEEEIVNNCEDLNQSPITPQ